MTVERTERTLPPKGRLARLTTVHRRPVLERGAARRRRVAARPSHVHQRASGNAGRSPAASAASQVKRCDPATDALGVAQARLEMRAHRVALAGVEEIACERGALLPESAEGERRFRRVAQMTYGGADVPAPQRDAPEDEVRLVSPAVDSSHPCVLGCRLQELASHLLRTLELARGERGVGQLDQRGPGDGAVPCARSVAGSPLSLVGGRALKLGVDALPVAAARVRARATRGELDLLRDPPAPFGLVGIELRRALEQLEGARRVVERVEVRRVGVHVRLAGVRAEGSIPARRQVSVPVRMHVLEEATSGIAGLPGARRVVDQPPQMVGVGGAELGHLRVARLQGGEELEAVGRDQRGARNEVVGGLHQPPLERHDVVLRQPPDVVRQGASDRPLGRSTAAHVQHVGEAELFKALVPLPGEMGLQPLRTLEEPARAFRVGELEVVRDVADLGRRVGAPQERAQQRVGARAHAWVGDVTEHGAQDEHGP
jgi:hypothetical protein